MIHKVALHQEDNLLSLKARLIYSYLLWKVSDIHKVIDDDWYCDQRIVNSFSGDFSNSYN